MCSILLIFKLKTNKTRAVKYTYNTLYDVDDRSP